jgi:hypothetical protein
MGSSRCAAVRFRSLELHEKNEQRRYPGVLLGGYPTSVTTVGDLDFVLHDDKVRLYI